MQKKEEEVVKKDKMQGFVTKVEKSPIMIIESGYKTRN
jgi:hypothetical protein